MESGLDEAILPRGNMGTYEAGRSKTMADAQLGDVLLGAFGWEDEHSDAVTGATCLNGGPLDARIALAEERGGLEMSAAPSWAASYSMWTTSTPRGSMTSPSVHQARCPARVGAACGWAEATDPQDSVCAGGGTPDPRGRPLRRRVSSHLQGDAGAQREREGCRQLHGVRPAEGEHQVWSEVHGAV